MIDRDKVIRGVECCSRPNSTNLCGECPYNKSETRFGCMHRLITDVFIMLKEQRYEYEKGFNDAMQGKQELMYEGVDGKWHKKDW